MARSGVLSDEDIIVKINSKAKEATGWYDSKLSKERERVLNYYNAQLPKRQSLGTSSFISTDVYDAVEAMKAQLLETFGGGDEIAQFDPDQDMSADDCKAATAYASHVIFSKNCGWDIFHDTIHDGLTARVGVAKVWFEEKFKYEDETFEGIPLDAVHGLAAQDNVDELDADHDDENPGTYKGTLVRKYDCSQVRIVQVPPEEFLITPRSVSLEEAAYCAHRTLKTKADLLEMFPKMKAKIATIHYDDSKGLDLSPEVLARNSPVETAQSLDNPIQPEMEQVMLYESYVRMQIDKAKGVRLYKIFHSSDVMLEYEEIDKRPFLCYVPLGIPHLFYGNNFAARVIQTQNARTVLYRAVLDHAAMTVNPRWQVVNGGLMNPREMLDNRQGGMVNVRRPDTVAALQVPQLNPFVFEILSKIGEESEKGTGISALSQGLNKDAISKQNSRGLVGDLVSLSTVRQKIAARNFAYGFFTALMLEVVRLAIVNKAQQEIVEVTGTPIKCDPQTWTERKTCTVSMHLGYGEKDAQVAKMQSAYQTLSKDPKLGTMFSEQNAYNLIRDTMKTAGLKNGMNYITPPQQAGPVPPDPFKTKELDIKQKMADAAMLTAQSLIEKDKRLAALDMSKLTLEQTHEHIEAAKADREQNRKDLETTAKIHTAAEEIELQKQTAETERKAILAPNP
jgi:hypothetical protein